MNSQQLPNPVVGEITSNEQEEINRVANLMQPGILSKGTDFSVQTTVFLKNNFNEITIKTAIVKLFELTESIKTTHGDTNTVLQSIIGINCDLTKKWFPNAPKKMRPMKEKKFSGERTGEIAFPATGGDLVLLVKGDRLDLCYETTKQFIEKIEDSNIERLRSTNGFKYLLGQDLSGFVDGTRNPVIQSIAVVTAAILSNQDLPNTGGSYMYAGIFVHNLKKFNSLSKVDKDHVIGREYGKVIVQTRTYYVDIYNPRLDDVFAHTNANAVVPEHVKKYHLNRGYGVILRQAWPWGTVEKSGLAFHAFSTSLDEIEDALDRMTGLNDGNIDSLFQFTTAVENNYYYCPNLNQISHLLTA